MLILVNITTNEEFCCPQIYTCNLILLAASIKGAQKRGSRFKPTGEGAFLGRGQDKDRRLKDKKCGLDKTSWFGPFKLSFYINLGGKDNNKKQHNDPVRLTGGRSHIFFAFPGSLVSVELRLEEKARWFHIPLLRTWRNFGNNSCRQY